MRRSTERTNSIIILVMTVVMYSAAMWWAVTSKNRWLGPCIDGPKHTWNQGRIQ